MTQQKRTMKHLSYGLEHPLDLLEKLKWDADKLTESPHRYDVFNFILTAAVLAEWIQKFYSSHSAPEPFAKPADGRKVWLIPHISPLWIGDTSCLPTPDCHINRHIENTLSICLHTANASKHFHWSDGGNITAIGEDPPIYTPHQWFFTSTAPDLYLDFQGENYGLQQIKGILIQFYTGLIDYLEGIQVQVPSPT